MLLKKKSPEYSEDGPASSPVAFKGGRGKREKNITATDLYSLQLHCTVPNEGPAEEAEDGPRFYILPTFFNP